MYLRFGAKLTNLSKKLQQLLVNFDKRAILCFPKIPDATNVFHHCNSYAKIKVFLIAVDAIWRISNFYLSQEMHKLLFFNNKTTWIFDVEPVNL